MHFLIENEQKCSEISLSRICQYLDKCEIKNTAGRAYIGMVIEAWLKRPKVSNISIIYRAVGYENKKKPIAIENGIRNILKSSGYGLYYSPKVFVLEAIEDLVFDREMPTAKRLKNIMELDSRVV